MRTVELPLTASLLGEASLVIASLVKTENARVAVTIGDENRAVRGRNSGGKAPPVGSLESGFRRSGDLQHHHAINLHLYKQPVFCGRAFLNGSVKELLSI